MNACRGCGDPALSRVLNLGVVPAADYFPWVTEPLNPEEACHPLAMSVCHSCGLAQLADDDTVAEEPRGIEPQALRDQSFAAITDVTEAGWLRGSRVREFGSPHGGTWIPHLADRGYATSTAEADVVLDCFGIMHEPDQRAAFAQRAEALRPGGVLLLQYHSIVTIVEQSQWNALRHGHFAYYSLSTLTRLLDEIGMRIVTAWEYGLYGGTVLLAAVRGDARPDDSVLRILAAEKALGITRPETVARLQRSVDKHVGSLRLWLDQEAAAGHTVVAYGAASRAVAVLSLAGIDSQLLPAVVDASPAKQGRRMPGTDIPIVSPDELVRSNPDRVLLTLPDLLPELQERYPDLDGRWQIDGQWSDIELGRSERHLA